MPASVALEAGPSEGACDTVRDASTWLRLVADVVSVSGAPETSPCVLESEEISKDLTVLLRIYEG